MRIQSWHGSLALSMLLVGCTLATDFDTSKTVENTDLLCSDGIDNDGTGLTDCQDWGCLSQRVCCTIPAVSLEDDFEGPSCAQASCDSPVASCDAIDPAIWQAWGAPVPVVCEGALSPHKEEQCYDVGVLSRSELVLQPGLNIAVGLVGRPEQKGRLEIGLTSQEEVLGAADECELLPGVTPTISIKQLADVGGYRLVARFDSRDIGVSDLIPDAGRHEVSMSIQDDRRMHYAIDGTTFAISPAEQPFPDTDLTAHLSLSGRGLTARFDDVRVTAGTQCDKPEAWLATEPFVALDVNAADEAWDHHAVFAPAVVRDPAGRMNMYYTGCRERAGQCDPLVTGVGRASPAEGLAFTRDDDCPIIGPPAAICENGLPNPFFDVLNNLIDVSVEIVGTEVFGFASQIVDGVEIDTVVIDGKNLSIVGAAADRVRTGVPGEWDSFELCCTTAIDHEGEVYLWYAGRDGPDASWRIGLAVSNDGVAFTKDASNPVMSQGIAGKFDDRGVSAPTVVYDAGRGIFRMWFAATGFLGTLSIGYAVSTDGVIWFKYPNNPVVLPADLGLVSVGAPDVLFDEGRGLMWFEGEAPADPVLRIYSAVNAGEAFAVPEE